MSAGCEFTLYRGESTAQGTPGWLWQGAEPVCFVMELPWRDNKPNESCIPTGRYEVIYLARSSSGRYRDVYYLKNVPERSGILIHAGNWAGDWHKGYRTDSWGCLLPACRLGLLAGQQAGLGSRAALRRLHQLTGRAGFVLNIEGYA